jgi:dTDP-4-amino-4,6-dideoxygalactose transaminase
MNTNKIIQHSSSTVSAVEFDYIKALAKRNYVGHGINCLALKKALAEYSKKTGIVLTHNGQAAVELALQRLKILYPKKNEVIVSGYVCPAVINAILSCSLKPIFADIEVNSFNIRVEDILNSCLSSKTLAIICTNTGGFPDDYISLLKLKIPIISDCAQAIGSSINNFPLISLGMMSIVSFGPTKMITAGCGGALICEKNNYESIEKAASPELSVKEYFKNGFLPTIGQHFSDLNAGLAFSQLGRLNEFIKKRHIIAMKYYEIFQILFYF